MHDGMNVGNIYFKILSAESTTMEIENVIFNTTE